MSAILSRLSIRFRNYISRDLDNTKILLFKLSIRYLVCQTCMFKHGISRVSFRVNVLNLNITVVGLCCDWNYIMNILISEENIRGFPEDWEHSIYWKYFVVVVFTKRLILVCQTERKEEA